MKFFNLGLSEIILIVILALIIFGPGNMVKTAKEAGVLIRKITKSPYWQEVWATKRELNEIPRMLAKEAQLDETIRDLNKETKNVSSAVAASVSDLIKEVNQPVELNTIASPNSAEPARPAQESSKSVTEKTDSEPKLV